MATFYGYLHTMSGAKAADVANFDPWTESLREVLSSKSWFTPYSDRKMPISKGWERYAYLSQRPLMNEDPDILGGPYPYPFYLFINSLTGSVIIGSWRYTITNVIVENINVAMNTNLTRNSFNVHKVCKTLIESESEDKNFFASNLQIEVNKYGSKLDTISLSGSDVLGSGFLSELENGDYTAKQIGLRSLEADTESARLLSNGGIQFYSDRLRQLEVCLGFVNRLGALFRNI